MSSWKLTEALWLLTPWQSENGERRQGGSHLKAQRNTSLVEKDPNLPPVKALLSI